MLLACSQIQEEDRQENWSWLNSVSIAARLLWLRSSGMNVLLSPDFRLLSESDRAHAAVARVRENDHQTHGMIDSSAGTDGRFRPGISSSPEV